jgi:serine/threonine-protein kinase
MSMTSQIPCVDCGAIIPADTTHCPACGVSQLGPEDAPEHWLGRVVDNKYEIEDVLGVGGMGMVFKARRVLVGDEVALKVLYPRFLQSPLQRRLFRDEARAAARLTHQNVVTVFDADTTEDGAAYIAMELLIGRTFKDVLKVEAPMPPWRIIPIIKGVCSGLAAAHQAGIIHRDLKPDNIFLQRRADGSERVKLVDFGIAAMLNVQAEDEADRLLGTLRYMAPEQCRGEVIDTRSDLYALGVILYESLTRRRATGKTMTDVIHGQVRPPNTLLPPDKAIPPGLEQLIMRLLAKHPQERPDTALEVRDALESRHESLVELEVIPITNPEIGLDDPAPVAPAATGSRGLWIGLGLAVLVGVLMGVLWSVLE